MITIFTITTLRPDSKRCVGYFEAFGDAEQAVLCNDGDIYEYGHWPLCVIEEILSNCIYPCPPVCEQWYKWNKAEEGYKRIEKPDSYKNVVNFGIG